MKINMYKLFNSVFEIFLRTIVAMYGYLTELTIFINFNLQTTRMHCTQCPFTFSLSNCYNRNPSLDCLTPMLSIIICFFFIIVFTRLTIFHSHVIK